MCACAARRGLEVDIGGSAVQLREGMERTVNIHLVVDTTYCALYFPEASFLVPGRVTLGSAGPLGPP